MKKSILAGLFIGLGGLVFLTLSALGSKIIGACMFAFGLISVFAYSAKLYTGWIGTINGKNFPQLGIILTGNVVGCALISLITYYSGNTEVIESVKSLVEARLVDSWTNVLLKSIACGMIMDIVCRAYRNSGTAVPALLGVPLFILCGFYHSIADIYYYICYCLDEWTITFSIVGTWNLTILGNAIGAQIIRILTK